MAGLWFSVIVLLCLRDVFARECSSLNSITNCNECVRCGGIWCNILDQYQCGRPSDSWCPSNREIIPTVQEISTSGMVVDPVYEEKSVLIGNSEKLKLQFQQLGNEVPDVKIDYINSSISNFNPHNFVADVENNQLDKKHKRIITIKVTPSTEFCPAGPSISESVTLRITIDSVSTPIVAKYHVPCGCGCSEKVEKNSPKCNGKGDYSCGACTCNSESRGPDCSEPCERGDMSSCMDRFTNTICSNNGKCSCDGKCECFKDRPFHTFFGDYCADLCTTVNSCDACLMNPTPGPCRGPNCNFPLFVENSTSLPSAPAERELWMECNVTTEEGDVIFYGATRDTSGEVRVIVIGSGAVSDTYGPGGPIKVTVPVVLGVLGLIAAAAAVAGFMVWKNKTPPLPLTDPGYHNIDAEDCTGMNPLYKSPMSSFKNPTYGKC